MDTVGTFEMARALNKVSGRMVLLLPDAEVLSNTAQTVHLHPQTLQCEGMGIICTGEQWDHECKSHFEPDPDLELNCVIRTSLLAPELVKLTLKRHNRSWLSMTLSDSFALMLQTVTRKHLLSSSRRRGKSGRTRPSWRVSWEEEKDQVKCCLKWHWSDEEMIF